MVTVRSGVSSALLQSVVMGALALGGIAAPPAFATADDEQPTPSGILRLVRDWRWC